MMVFSTRQYFLKLHNMLYLIVVVPLLLFGYVYLRGVSVPETSMTLLSNILIIFFMALFGVSAWMFSRRIKAMRSVPLLTERLRSYAGATITRFSMMSAGCFLLTAGFFLSANPVHVGLFVVSMICLSLWWPSPQKVSKDLLLRQDEREIILRQKDIADN